MRAAQLSLAILLLTCTLPLQAGLFTKDGQVDKNALSNRVAKEIVTQLADQSKKKSVEKPVKNYDNYVSRAAQYTGGSLYLQPHWSAPSLFFNDNDMIHVNVTFDTASHSYSGGGGSQDLSKLIFGEQPVTVKEILLASKLASTGKIIALEPLASVDLAAANNTQQNHYLSILADQEVGFDASLWRLATTVSLSRYFRDGDIVVGFQVPIKFREQRLFMTNDLSSDMSTKLRAAEGGKNPFTGKYVAVDTSPIFHFFKHFTDLQDFVTQVLGEKGIALNKKDSIVGMGDVSAYMHINIPTRYADHFVVGASLLLPTAHAKDTAKLWYEELGNGGFIETALFTSMQWQRSRWFNPYVHAKAVYAVNANQYRRVPDQNSHTKVGNDNFFNDIKIDDSSLVRGYLIMGETFRFMNNVNFSEPDSTMRGFADKSQKTNIRPGPQGFLRLGSTIDAVFTHKGFLDLFYDLHLKGKDYIERPHIDARAQTGILGHNTSQVSHLAGINYAYQFDENYRGRLGTFYTFAGRNVQKTWGVELNLSAEF